MEEKGGKTNKGGKYIDSHHMLLIFMIVLNLVVLVLCLVFLGMQLVRREENLAHTQLEKEAGEYTIEIKPLRFDVLAKASYESTNPNQNAGTNLLSGKVVDKAEYQVIQSGSQLNDVLNTLHSASINTQEFDLVSIDESFFETGSVIAVAMEDQGLENFQVGKMTRDENGAVTIVGSYSSNSDVEKTYGAIVLIKVENVQTNSIELDISEK